VQNKFFCKKPYIDLFETTSSSSKIISQILYGEKFKILLKKKNWVKIKTSFDNYNGYIKNKNYIKNFEPTHKIKSLKSIVFNNPKNLNKYKSKISLPFASKIKILKENKSFVMFEKNKWIEKKNIEKIKKKKKFLKILKMFLGAKYKWGGKSYSGIDCSGILQIIFYYNNKYFPRDTKDQINIFKKKVLKKLYKKGDIIFWEGHVAICINSNLLIHAYGPKKKVLIMPIKKTISLIEKTAKLKIKKITQINL
jgi:hypothetical protein